MKEMANTNATDIEWLVTKKGTERIRLGVVVARLWMDAREKACQEYMLDRGEIEVVPNEPQKRKNGR